MTLRQFEIICKGTLAGYAIGLAICLVVAAGVAWKVLP